MRNYLLLQLSFLLFLSASSRIWDTGVRRAVEDVLPVNSTLTQGSPSFSVVVFHVIRINWGGGNVILQRPEIGEHVCDADLAVFVDWEVARSQGAYLRNGTGAKGRKENLRPSIVML